MNVFEKKPTKNLHLIIFSKFYRRCYDLISKFQVGLISRLRYDLSKIVSEYDQEIPQSQTAET